MFNGDDLDAIMPHSEEDAVFDVSRGPTPWRERFVGRTEVRRGLVRRFKGLPDVHPSDDRHRVAGDRGVSERPLTGTTMSGRETIVRGGNLSGVGDDRVVRKDSFWKIGVP